MKLFSVVILVFLTSLKSGAQGVLFDTPYRLDIDSDCRLAAVINKRMVMTLTLNEKTVCSKLVFNRNQPNSYDFNDRRRRLSFVVVFGRDEEGNYLTIANQQYLKFFFRCDDRKYLTLYTATP